MKVAIFPMLALVLLTSCVERYRPDDLYLRFGLLVVNAHITDQPGIQTIEVSRSSHIENPGLIPETDCYVQLLREDDESRVFGPSDRPGYYTAMLDTDFLITGMSYQMQLITPDGNEYHSDFDRLRPVPEIDSLYFKVESTMFTGEKEATPGIRFYNDFTYDDEAYEYIRWELTETYEFHNPKMEAYFYSSRWRSPQLLTGEDNSRICYITHIIPNVYSLATEQLSLGSFSKPFDFVPNDIMNQKLMFKYSLLVRQYSMGPEGFHYWNELGKNNQSQGSLFTRQPAMVISNICNIADENEKVLGFFTMSGMREARAMAENIPGMDHKPYPYYCLPVDKGPGSGSPTKYPAYFARASYDGTTVYAEVNKHCVDCREYRGSTAEKPDFW